MDHLRADIGLGVGDTSKLAIPGFLTHRIVEQDQSPRGTVVVCIDLGVNGGRKGRDSVGRFSFLDVNTGVPLKGAEVMHSGSEGRRKDSDCMGATHLTRLSSGGQATGSDARKKTRNPS